MKYIGLILGVFSFGVFAKELPSPDKIKNFFSEEKLIQLKDWKVNDKYQSASLSDAVFMINDKSVSVMMGVKDDGDNLVGVLKVLQKCMKVAESVNGELRDSQIKEVISTVSTTTKAPGKKIVTMIGGYHFSATATPLGENVMFDCSMSSD